MEYHEKPRICRTMVKQTYPLRNFWTGLFMGASSCLSLFLTKAIRPYFHFLVADLHNTLRSTKGGILSLGLMVVMKVHLLSVCMIFLVHNCRYLMVNRIGEELSHQGLLK